MIISAELSQYEIERNKPMPNRIHGVIQGQLIFLLKSLYKNRFQIASEVSLATDPGSTPDVCIFPKKQLNRRVIESTEKEAPITTVEIQSPSQSIEQLEAKAWNLYFPMGVKSAWIVIPSLKAVKILLPDDNEFFFNSGTVQDPETKVELSLNEIFEELD